MSTTLHTFVDIFDTKIEDGENSVKLKEIVIPIIQRDYAQGRHNDEVDRVRARFLDSLHEAVTKKPLTLDFVYGGLDETGKMTPLDGQQRLTTLYLLHWYAAKKEGVPDEKCRFLTRFTYETRYSSRDFCKSLVGFNPSFTIPLSTEIRDQAWFPLDYENDPTIRSMLVMLDAIDERFKDVPDLWDKLKQGAISFYFLPIKDMGLTDELYIKMNSRGKPLTLFEHFKAELERNLRLLEEKGGPKVADSLMGKIDGPWTDLLWTYCRGSGENIVDDEFIRYFRFAFDILCYRKGESPQSHSSDLFDLLHLYFSPESKDARKNLATLEAFFDCWGEIPGAMSPKAFLESFMGPVHEENKIIVASDKVDIFEDCLHGYADKSGRVRQFPLSRMLLLYAIVVYLLHQKEVKDSEFVKRIRIVNNLIQNSSDEISDRVENNRIPEIIKAIDSIIVKGQFDDSLGPNFNANQIEEEKEKLEFLLENPERGEELYRLEDHPLLYGQIGIIGLENLDLGPRFASLFTCNKDNIDCALMTIGNYAQRERNGWRYQVGSSGNLSAWEALFHRSANEGFENTKRILVELLKSHETFSDGVLDSMIEDFIHKSEAKKEYPWTYYYVKYPIFRPGKYGKLSNGNASEAPYMFAVLTTKKAWSENTYMPYLKEADPAHLSGEHLGRRLVYRDVYITCENAAYLLHKNEDDSLIETIPVSQNEAGIDIEDRIVKLKEYIAQMGLS